MHINKLYKVVSDYEVLYCGDTELLARGGFDSEQEATEYVISFVDNYKNCPNNGWSSFEFEIVPYYELIK